jgi:hypothetical protein
MHCAAASETAAWTISKKKKAESSVSLRESKKPSAMAWIFSRGDRSMASILIKKPLELSTAISTRALKRASV